MKQEQPLVNGWQGPALGFRQIIVEKQERGLTLMPNEVLKVLPEFKHLNVFCFFKDLPKEIKSSIAET